MKNIRKTLTILGIGALAGALLGVLFAPYKGSKIRRKIKGEGKRIADDVQDQFRKGKEKVTSLKEKIERII